jgi:hypothetical protein
MKTSTKFEIEYIQSKPLSQKEKEKLSALIAKNKLDAQQKSLLN